MTLLFLHFRWAFSTRQECIGAEVHGTDGRAGGEREAAPTKPRSEVDVGQVALGMEGTAGHLRHHTCQHPLYLLVQPPALRAAAVAIPCPMFHQDLVSDSDLPQTLDPERTRQSRGHKDSQLTLICLPHKHKAP